MPSTAYMLVAVCMLSQECGKVVAGDTVATQPFALQAVAVAVARLPRARRAPLAALRPQGRLPQQDRNH